MFERDALGESDTLNHWARLVLGSTLGPIAIGFAILWLGVILGLRDTWLDKGAFVAILIWGNVVLPSLAARSVDGSIAILIAAVQWSVVASLLFPVSRRFRGLSAWLISFGIVLAIGIAVSKAMRLAGVQFGGDGI
jgi:hypothetical protein